ncbi:MAG TPA: YdcF family protein [Bacillus sp. (in: firmicutes)]|nr:YdcF family protein [Bacillus sp. (in: firmicutes)]
MRNLFLVIGIIGLLYCMNLIRIANIDTGAVVIFAFSLFFIAIYVFYRPLKTVWSRKRSARILVLTLLGALIIVSCVLEGLILSSIADDHPKKLDYVLVLGAGIRKGKPSPVLKERLNKAVDYLKAYPKAKVVVSGGKGYDEPVSEASVMEDYLLAHGIPSQRIVKEEKATSTYENLKFSRDLMNRQSVVHYPERVLIISSNFHLHRAKSMARDLGLEAFGAGSKVPLSVIPQVHVREILALAKYYVFDKMGNP